MNHSDDTVSVLTAESILLREGHSLAGLMFAMPAAFNMTTGRVYTCAIARFIGFESSAVLAV